MPVPRPNVQLEPYLLSPRPGSDDGSPAYSRRCSGPSRRAPTASRGWCHRPRRGPRCPRSPHPARPGPGEAVEAGGKAATAGAPRRHRVTPDRPVSNFRYCCSGVREAGLIRGWPKKGAAWLRFRGQPFRGSGAESGLLLDAEHGVAERSELGVDEGLMTPVGGSPIDGVSIAVCHAPVLTRSAVQEDRDVSLGFELPGEVFAQARLVARHDVVVSAHDGHGNIFHETLVSVKVGGADPGRVGPSVLFWKDGGDCRACPARVRRLLPRGP